MYSGLTEDGVWWGLAQLMLKCVHDKDQRERKLKRSSGARSNRDFLAWRQTLIFILQVMETSKGFSAHEWHDQIFLFRTITTMSVQVGWGGRLPLGGRRYWTLIGWPRQGPGKNEETLRAGPCEHTVPSLCSSGKKPCCFLKIQHPEHVSVILHFNKLNNILMDLATATQPRTLHKGHGSANPVG